MTKLAGPVFGLLLGLSTAAAAVPVDPGGSAGIVIEQRAPGSLLWDLYLFSAPGAEVAVVGVAASGFTSFEFDITVVNLSPADSAFGFIGDVSMLLLRSDPGSFSALGGSDDLDGLLLGTYTSALPTLESVALVDVGTSHPTEFPYPADEVRGVIVPEAGASRLGLLALAALASARLRSAQHRPR